jgi:hypothetical protein
MQAMHGVRWPPLYSLSFYFATLGKGQSLVGINELHINLWVDLSFPDWWNMMSSGQNHKAMASLTMLIIWKIWSERNDRVFKNKHPPSQVVVNKITREASLWVLAGAKSLGLLMPRE